MYLLPRIYWWQKPDWLIRFWYCRLMVSVNRYLFILSEQTQHFEYHECIYYNIFRPSSGKITRHKWKSIYWGRGPPFTVFLCLMWPNKEFLQSCLMYSWIFSSNSSNLCRFLCRYLLSKTYKDRNLVVLDLNSEGPQLSKNNTITKEYSYPLQC